MDGQVDEERSPKATGRIRHLVSGFSLVLSHLLHLLPFVFFFSLVLLLLLLLRVHLLDAAGQAGTKVVPLYLSDSEQKNGALCFFFPLSFTEFSSSSSSSSSSSLVSRFLSNRFHLAPVARALSFLSNFLLPPPIRFLSLSLSLSLVRDRFLSRPHTVVVVVVVVVVCCRRFFRAVDLHYRRIFSAELIELNW